MPESYSRWGWRGESGVFSWRHGYKYTASMRRLPRAALWFGPCRRRVQLSERSAQCSEWCRFSLTHTHTHPAREVCVCLLFSDSFSVEPPQPCPEVCLFSEALAASWVGPGSLQLVWKYLPINTEGSQYLPSQHLKWVFPMTCHIFTESDWWQTLSLRAFLCLKLLNLPPMRKK